MHPLTNRVVKGSLTTEGADKADEGGDRRIAPGLGERRSAIVACALRELDRGVWESPPGSNKGARIAEYMPAWAYGGSWCAGFACWVMREALGEIPTGLFRVGVHALKGDAEKRGLWRPKKSYFPDPGDLFIMDMGRGTGHVGFVLGARSGEIETIEGNSGDRVRLGRRRIDDARLVGYVETVSDEPYRQCWWTGEGETNGGLGTQ